jgi:peptidoglycan/LPS O-acetylase OafA/YrhL
MREKGTEWVDKAAVSYGLNLINVAVPRSVVSGHDPVVVGGHRLAPACRRRTDSGAAATPGRIPAIDVVKGLAILGVIAQHALTRENMDGTGADFWLRQSVPVLFVLMGFNAARASLRRSAPPLAEAYGARYWRGRFHRILLPLLIVSVVAIVAGAASGHLHLRALALVGYLPVPGPGVYWITILLTFTLIWPAWMHLFRLRPGLVVVAAIALDVGFELWAGRVPEFRGAGSGGGYPYAYDASILRYFAAIAIGMWLAIDDGRAARRRLVVMALAVPSVAYIALAGTDPASLPYFVHGFTLATNFAAVPWAAAMLLAILHLWPARSVPGTGWLERVGTASYEVFLVQVVWLGVLQERGLVHFRVAAVASGLLGCALHRVLTGTTVGLARPAPRRTAQAFDS